MAGTAKELRALEEEMGDLRRAVEAHRAVLDGLDEVVDSNAYLRASLSVRQAAGVFASDLEILGEMLEAYEPDDEHPDLPVAPGALVDVQRRSARSLHEIAMGLTRLTGHPRARIGGPGEALGAESPAAALPAQVERLLVHLRSVGLRILELSDPAAAKLRKLRR